MIFQRAEIYVMLKFTVKSMYLLQYTVNFCESLVVDKCQSLSAFSVNFIISIIQYLMFTLIQLLYV